MEAGPAIPGSRIGFRQVPRARRSRTGHLDPGIRYVTLADPEGNEFDLITR